jgi:GNAT superfamily N-acetyltransferase
VCVRRQNFTAHLQRSAAKLGQAGDRRAARPVEPGEERALGRDAQRGRRIVEGSDEPRGVGVVGANLDSNRALRHRGQHDIGVHARLIFARSSPVEPAHRKRGVARLFELLKRVSTLQRTTRDRAPAAPAWRRRGVPVRRREVGQWSYLRLKKARAGPRA